MRESRTYGSVRGARGNSRPYRECAGFAAMQSLLAVRAKHDATLKVSAFRGQQIVSAASVAARLLSISSGLSPHAPGGR